MAASLVEALTVIEPVVPAPEVTEPPPDPEVPLAEVPPAEVPPALPVPALAALDTLLVGGTDEDKPLAPPPLQAARNQLKAARTR